MKRVIKLPPNYWPPDDFEFFGRQTDGVVKLFLVRKNPREMLEVEWVEGFEIPGTLREYFQSCLEGK